MKNKVILVSIDGMRPDGVINCKNPFVEQLMKMGSYTLDARTVSPSVTFPCHMSMFQHPLLRKSWRFLLPLSGRVSRFWRGK